MPKCKSKLLFLPAKLSVVMLAGVDYWDSLRPVCVLFICVDLLRSMIGLCVK